LKVMASKQQQAPGDLEFVRAFVNTAELEHNHDELASGAALGRWLRTQGLGAGGLRPSQVDLGRAVELREALRAILLAHSEGSPTPSGAWETLDLAARRGRLRLQFGADGQGRLEPEAGGVDGALSRILAIVHSSMADGTWERLKACRQPTCQWIFYDHTKNHSGSWCTMGLCGNRAKARAYRTRQRKASSEARR
jgi:predicted RNA-binding Zn ribbon-like protein